MVKTLSNSEVNIIKSDYAFIIGTPESNNFNGLVYIFQSFLLTYININMYAYYIMYIIL